MANAFPQAIALLRRSGISIRPVDISDQLKKLNDASVLIGAYEGARFHEANLKKFGDRFDPALADYVRDGLKIPVQRYNEVKQFVADSRRRFAEIFRFTPVILTPAAPGPAPLGLLTTGDPRMNAPWSAMGNPAVSIPMPVASGLPLGLQLAADLKQDSLVLQAALLLYQRFSTGPKISSN
jgi:Asp-tRNA(Asn)/Glu-tRNA(Gln) amidotransferase A subunit family amidase